MSERVIEPLSAEEFCSIIARFKSRMIVQNIGIYHGSLLYIIMDTKISIRDNMIELGIWADLWKLFKDKKKICDSETITRDFAENQLLKMMKYESFESITVEKNTTTLVISNGFSVVIEHEPHAEYPDLLILSLPDIVRGNTITLTNESPPQFKIEYNKE